ncbi:hypothetical protein EPN90_03160 [Patescibacteria group bacterium]|nr:MAG: hypothetical protein EPN90_03160 [Patescibacteria group bacterium]
MNLKTQISEISKHLAAPVAALAFGSLFLELLAPGIVSRWLPLPLFFFSLLLLALVAHLFANSD